MSVPPLRFGSSFIIQREGDLQGAMQAVQHALKAPVDIEDKDQFEIIDRSLKKGESQGFGMYIEPEKYKDPRAAKGYYVFHVPDEADDIVMFSLNDLGVLYKRIKKSIVVTFKHMFKQEGLRAVANGR